MTVDAEKDFVAIGQLAANIGKPVRAIEQAAEQLQLNPALRLNRVPFFNGAQVARLTAELSKGSK